jgi:hypothetical protein
MNTRVVARRRGAADRGEHRQAAKLVDNAALSAACDKEGGGTWPDSVHNFEQPTTGERTEVWWEILSVLAPVVCVALLGLIALYALSRAPRRSQ